MTTTPGTMSPEQVLAMAAIEKAKAEGKGPALTEGPAAGPILLPGESTTNKPGERTMDPLQNPGAAQAMANEMMGKGDENKPIAINRPPVDTIELPGGWIDRTGTLHKTARIRELNGADEEELARPYQKTAAQFVDTVVSRCTVDIGGQKVGNNELRQMLIGDRDAILIGVRILTFGSHMHVPVQCPTCRHEFTIDLDLESDIDTKELPDNEGGDPRSRTRELTLPRGQIVKVNLIDGAAQLAAYGDLGEELNRVERESLLLRECVYSINDEPVSNLAEIKKLSANDRREILKFLNENACGPQWGRVEQECPNCQAKFDLPLSLVALFL